MAKSLSKEESRPRITLFLLVLLFSALAIAFYTGVIPAGQIYAALVFFAIAFFAAEAYSWRKEPDRIGRAFYVGLFLTGFDIIFENLGMVFNLWQTHGALFSIGVAPIEILAVAAIGGTAWALYLPRRLDPRHSSVDIFVFAVFGAFGEYLLRLAGLISYYQWWTAVLAFVAYGLTWMLLHYVRYYAVRVD